MIVSYELTTRFVNYHEETGATEIDLGHYGGWAPVYHVLHFGPRTARDIEKIAKNLKRFLKKNLKRVDPYRSKAEVHEFIHESLEEFFWPEKFSEKQWNPPKLTRTGRGENFDLYDVLEINQASTVPSFEYPSSKPYQQRRTRRWAYARERGKNHLRARSSDGKTRNYSYAKMGGAYYASEKEHICSPLEWPKENKKLRHEKERIIGIVVKLHGMHPEITLHRGFIDPASEDYLVHGEQWRIEEITL